MLPVLSDPVPTDAPLGIGMLPGLAVALAFASLLGAAWSRWTHARAVHRDAKQRLPALRRARWRQWSVMTGYGVLVLAVLVVVMVVGDPGAGRG
ncbi:hypothetical protein [Isoptericola haloaureus]|uniref:Uncharacterized protein n=1 Tax=Isoptericola haloaureus TaxID=1542902 RepID=A0ABU7Z373_9MICO